MFYSPDENTSEKTRHLVLAKLNTSSYEIAYSRDRVPSEHRFLELLSQSPLPGRRREPTFLCSRLWFARLRKHFLGYYFQWKMSKQKLDDENVFLHNTFVRPLGWLFECSVPVEDVYSFAYICDSIPSRIRTHFDEIRPHGVVADITINPSSSHLSSAKRIYVAMDITDDNRLLGIIFPDGTQNQVIVIPILLQNIKQWLQEISRHDSNIDIYIQKSDIMSFSQNKCLEFVLWNKKEDSNPSYRPARGRIHMCQVDPSNRHVSRQEQEVFDCPICIIDLRQLEDGKRYDYYRSECLEEHVLVDYNGKIGLIDTNRFSFLSKLLPFSTGWFEKSNVIHKGSIAAKITEVYPFVRYRKLRSQEPDVILAGSDVPKQSSRLYCNQTDTYMSVT